MKKDRNYFLTKVNKKYNKQTIFDRSVNHLIKTPNDFFQSSKLTYLTVNEMSNVERVSNDFTRCKYLYMNSLHELQDNICSLYDIILAMPNTQKYYSVDNKFRHVTIFNHRFFNCSIVLYMNKYHNEKHLFIYYNNENYYNYFLNYLYHEHTISNINFAENNLTNEKLLNEC